MYIPLIIDSDSYKTSHWKQYPPGTEYVSSYIEPRNSMFRASHMPTPAGYDGSVFFGLQYFLKEYLSRPIDLGDIVEAEQLFKGHGVPFNKEGWLKLYHKHGGVFPLHVQALPEGMITPAGTPQVQVVNTDPDFYWLTSYVETRMLSAVWYGSTVATLSREIKRVLAEKLKQTNGNTDGIDFMLHDFGSRGVSSQESAQLGGMGHLINFMGTDTLAAIWAAQRYYDAAMAGFSIPAAEHSTITAWTKEGEVEAYRNMLTQFGASPIVAVVSDSYDIYNAVKNIWGDVLRDEVRAYGRAGGKLVIRPDSGTPETVVPDILDILGTQYGYTVNAQGYKMLPKWLGVIQGDGINYESIKRIVNAVAARKWAISNLAFGMGGALLQQVNRDTLGYAMKASAMRINGKWRDIYKDPVTDSEKKSKRGIQHVVLDPDSTLAVLNDAEFGSFNIDDDPMASDLLKSVWRDGELLVNHTFADIRGRAELR